MSFIKATSTQKMQMCKQLPRMEWQTDEDLWHAVRVCKDASSWYNARTSTPKEQSKMFCSLSVFRLLRRRHGSAALHFDVSM